jgi:hypothetical protein
VSLVRVTAPGAGGGKLGVCGPMQLRLSDPSYTDRLAHFLRSLGQTAIVAGPTQLEVETSHSELLIYLRVWAVLYPDAEVQLGTGGNDAPAA